MEKRIKKASSSERASQKDSKQLNSSFFSSNSLFKDTRAEFYWSQK
jgi:hypothetical protein